MSWLPASATLALVLGVLWLPQGTNGDMGVAQMLIKEFETIKAKCPFAPSIMGVWENCLVLEKDQIVPAFACFLRDNQIDCTPKPNKIVAGKMQAESVERFFAVWESVSEEAKKEFCPCLRVCLEKRKHRLMPSMACMVDKCFVHLKACLE